ncbi:hypothetical protein O181_020749 [Austropuccinia psidii MF-1]|uniref:Uncharacterized protein n=1 Tax=Austropuccinia psidii MF-1 TaxID=1389203 RepID=A0A9Q3C9H7_9BASI|nr:hypothetical protein [Austropuccinia psidii MF-1]
MRPKGAKGQSNIPQGQVSPKPQMGPPELAFGPKIGQEPQNGHNSVHGLWQPPDATSSAPGKDSHQTKVGDSESSPNPSPTLMKDYSATNSVNSLAATRRPFEDPNNLALQELGCQFSSRLF